MWPQLLSDLSELIIIEQIRNIDDKHNVDKRLLTREAFWWAQLCTLSLQPNGLTKRSEFSSKNRIEYNWHISSFELHLLFHHFLIIFLIVSCRCTQGLLSGILLFFHRFSFPRSLLFVPYYFLLKVCALGLCNINPFDSIQRPRIDWTKISLEALPSSW